MFLYRNKRRQTLTKEAFSRMIHAEFNRSLILISDRDLLVNNIVSKIAQILPVSRIAVFRVHSKLSFFFEPDCRKGALTTSNLRFQNVAFSDDDNRLEKSDFHNHNRLEKSDFHNHRS
jgi:hypothetical protein